MKAVVVGGAQQPSKVFSGLGKAVAARIGGFQGLAVGLCCRPPVRFSASTPPWYARGEVPFGRVPHQPVVLM